MSSSSDSCLTMAIGGPIFVFVILLLILAYSYRWFKGNSRVKRFVANLKSCCYCFVTTQDADPDNPLTYSYRKARDETPQRLFFYDQSRDENKLKLSLFNVAPEEGKPHLSKWKYRWQIFNLLREIYLFQTLALLWLIPKNDTPTGLIGNAWLIFVILLVFAACLTALYTVIEIDCRKRLYYALLPHDVVIDFDNTPAYKRPRFLILLCCAFLLYGLGFSLCDWSHNREGVSIFFALIYFTYKAIAFEESLIAWNKVLEDTDKKEEATKGQHNPLLLLNENEISLFLLNKKIQIKQRLEEYKQYLNLILNENGERLKIKKENQNEIIMGLMLFFPRPYINLNRKDIELFVGRTSGAQEKSTEENGKSYPIDKVRRELTPWIDENLGFTEIVKKYWKLFFSFNQYASTTRSYIAAIPYRANKDKFDSPVINENFHIAMKLAQNDLQEFQKNKRIFFCFPSFFNAFQFLDPIVSELANENFILPLPNSVQTISPPAVVSEPKEKYSVAEGDEPDVESESIA